MTTPELIANSPVPGLEVAITTVQTLINPGDPTIAVNSPAPTPLQASPGQFRIVVDNEIMIVTAGASGTSWTVTRGAELSTPASHAAGTKVWHTLTAGALKALLASGSSIIDGILISGTPSVGQVITATSTTTADWQTPASLTVTDGTHTESSVTDVTFSGAVVSTTGAGEATVTISGGGSPLEVTDGTNTEMSVTDLTFSGAVVSTTGAGEATVTVKQLGVPVVYGFHFAYNTPNLLTGAFLYQPALGDVMIEAWVEIDTAWNGTTPKLDVGTFSYGDTTGWWATQGSAVPLLASRADGGQLDEIFNTQTYSSPTVTPSSRLSDITNFSMTTLNARQRRLPASVYDDTQSIKVCVSQDGSTTGANPGSTQGSGIIYMMWVTPHP